MALKKTVNPPRKTNPKSKMTDVKEPGKLNVWLIRTNDFALEKFRQVVILLSDNKSPMEFKVKDENPIDGDSIDTGNFGKPWSYFFDLADKFREIKGDLGDDEFVVVLSNKANQLNWFSGADYGGKRNIFVHTDDWEFFSKHEDESYPIAYHVAITIIHHLWFKHANEISGDNIHHNPIGCMNDFCRNKGQVNLKMRTADICPSCIKKILGRDIKLPVIVQVLSILEKIRKGMLFKELLANFETTPELIVDKKIFFVKDLGIQLNFKNVGAIGRGLYHYFLENEEGSSFEELIDGGENFDNLFECYWKQKNPGGRVYVINAARREENKKILINGLKNISSLISRMNSSIEADLGPALAKIFSITGERGGIRKITIDRKYVKFIQ
jgi:hypothetical protein